MKGWICLHRKILESDVWMDDEEPFDKRSAWVDLLLMANHKENSMIFDGHKLVVERGQIVTSVRKLSSRWRWSKNRTLRFLRLLEELDMIQRESNARRTLITVVNYGVYQDRRDTNEYTNEYTSGDSSRDTSGDSSVPQTTMTNNLLNNSINKRGKNFSPPTVEEVRAYCQERNNTINPEAFIDYYASQKWKKANGRPVEDWKACVRTWEKRERPQEKPKNKFVNFEGRQYDTMELERKLNGNWG